MEATLRSGIPTPPALRVASFQGPEGENITSLIKNPCFVKFHRHIRLATEAVVSHALQLYQRN